MRFQASPFFFFYSRGGLGLSLGCRAGESRRSAIIFMFSGRQEYLLYNSLPVPIINRLNSVSFFFVIQRIIYQANLAKKEKKRGKCVIHHYNRFMEKFIRLRVEPLRIIIRARFNFQSIGIVEHVQFSNDRLHILLGVEPRDSLCEFKIRPSSSPPRNWGISVTECNDIAVS